MKYLVMEIQTMLSDGGFVNSGVFHHGTDEEAE